MVKENRLGRHVAVTDCKLFRVGGPFKVMDGTFLVKRHSTVKVTSCTEQVHVGLAIVTLVGVINVGLCEEQDLCAQRVPLDLRPICFEKVLLARWRRLERKEAVDFNASW